jgi:hypothetical protein
VGGWQRITTTPLISTPRRIISGTDNTDIRRLFIGADAGAFLVEGATVRNITPASFVPLNSVSGLPTGYGVGAFGAEAWNTPRSTGSAAFLRAQTWTLDNFGQDVYGVASTDGRLLRWDASTPNAAMAVVPNAPLNNRAMCITPERHVLIIGAGGNRRRVQWSARENPTNWTAASVTGTSGFLDLDTEGLLIGLAEVQGGTLVFSDSDAWLIEFIGGNFVYRVRPVGTATSLVSPRTVVSIAGRAYWMGRNGFWFYEGGLVRPLPCEVQDYIFDDIDPVWGVLTAHGGNSGNFQECWWFWPSRGSTEPNRYCIFNYAENTWSIGTLARTAMMPGGVNPFPVMSGTDHHLYQHEDGFTNAGLPRLGTVWAETANVSQDGESLAVMQAQADSNSTVAGTQMRVYARPTRDGPDTMFGPFAPTSDGRTPIRGGGPNVRVRVEATHDGLWSIGRMSVDVRPVGRR